MILVPTFSVETQKICGVGSGLVADWLETERDYWLFFSLIRTKDLLVGNPVSGSDNA